MDIMNMSITEEVASTCMYVYTVLTVDLTPVQKKTSLVFRMHAYVQVRMKGMIPVCSNSP